MNISKNNLLAAASQNGIEEKQAEALWNHLAASKSSSGKAHFSTAHIVYYIGALIIIGAMGWFMTNAWEKFGGQGIFAIATGYLLIFAYCGAKMWRREGLRIPAGLLLTVAVCMVPLATYGVERWTEYWPANDPGGYANFHPYINGSWLIMEIATIIAGLVFLFFWRFSFLTAPIAYALWFMSMDLADFIVHGSYHKQEQVTMLFGLAMLLATYLADLRSRLTDFAFWGYIFGVMAFWGGLTSMHSDSELSKFIYCLFNLFMIFLSLALNRRVFLIFGAIGLFCYICHLAEKVFKDSLAFPFVLSLVGLLVIGCGIVLQKNHKKIRKWFDANILPHIRNVIPPSALVD